MDGTKTWWFGLGDKLSDQTDLFFFPNEDWFSGESRIETRLDAWGSNCAGEATVQERWGQDDVSTYSEQFNMGLTAR